MFADVILSGAEGKIAKRFSRRIPQNRKQTSIIRGFLRALRLVEMTFFVHRPRATARVAPTHDITIINTVGNKTFQIIKPIFPTETLNSQL